jgi:hypothetical protein
MNGKTAIVRGGEARKVEFCDGTIWKEWRRKNRGSKDTFLVLVEPIDELYVVLKFRRKIRKN